MTNGTPRSAIGTASYLLEYAAVMPSLSVLERQGVPHGLSFARDIFARVGRYPEDVRMGEDTVFNQRCLAAGVRVAFDPEIAIEHRNPTRLRPFLAHQFGHGRGLARCSLDYGIYPRLAAALHRGGPHAGLELFVRYPLRSLRRRGALRRPGPARLAATIGTPVTARRSWGHGKRCRGLERVALAGVSPGVSVVVAAFDEERWIERCLRALLRQTHPSYEVVVVDDGSTDATALVAERLGVRVLRRPHLGAGAARDAGLRAARGEIVVFADADDVCDPDFLERLTAPFADPRVRATFPGGTSFLNSAEGLAREWLRVRGFEHGRPPTYGSTNLIAKAVRRKIVLELGGYPHAGWGEDLLLGERVGPALVVPDARWQVTVPSSSREIFRSARWMGRGPRFERERPPLWLLLPPIGWTRAVGRVRQGGMRLAWVQLLYDVGRVIGFAESRLRPRFRGAR